MKPRKLRGRIGNRTDVGGDDDGRTRAAKRARSTRRELDPVIKTPYPVEGAIHIRIQELYSNYELIASLFGDACQFGFVAQHNQLLENDDDRVVGAGDLYMSPEIEDIDGYRTEAAGPCST